MQVKGSALCARVKFVRERGEDAYRSWLEGLSAPSREMTESGFLATEWYPFEVFLELCESIDSTFGNGDLSLCYELGRYACDKNLPTLYRLFFKVGNVGYIVSRAQVAWQVTYNRGEMQTIERDDHSALLEIQRWPEPRRAHCLSVLGWMVRAAEISGATQLSWHEDCRALGDESCRFAVQWE